MERNPVLDLPLNEVLRSEIALSLQHVLHVYTVGNLLHAWQSPRNQRDIEMIFDSPEQARQATRLCATWVGVPFQASPLHTRPWW